MKNIFVCLAVCLAVSAFPLVAGAAETADCARVEKTVQTEVKRENNVCSMEVVRTNLNVTRNGLKLAPEMMGLTFVAAFEQVGEKAAVTGEFALLEKEVNPVIRALQAGGLEVTALHNHMMGEHPRVMYVHFQGLGTLDRLAQAVKTAMDAANKPANGEAASRPTAAL